MTERAGGNFGSRPTLTEEELAAEFGVDSLEEIADDFYADYLQWDDPPGGWFFVEVPSETQATELACSLRYAGHQVRPPYQDDKQLPASRAGWWIVDYR